MNVKAGPAVRDCSARQVTLEKLNYSSGRHPLQDRCPRLSQVICIRKDVKIVRWRERSMGPAEIGAKVMCGREGVAEHCQNCAQPEPRNPNGLTNLPCPFLTSETTSTLSQPFRA